MYFDLNNERMVASSKSYHKMRRRLEEDYDCLCPEPQDGQLLNDWLAECFCQVQRVQARRAVRETYKRTLCVAAQQLPDDPEDGLYVPRGEIVIKAASVGQIITPPFNSWSHL